MKRTTICRILLSLTLLLFSPEILFAQPCSFTAKLNGLAQGSSSGSGLCLLPLPGGNIPVQLNASPTGAGYSYLWKTITNGTTVTFASGSGLNVLNPVSTIFPTKYSVQITDSNGCNNISGEYTLYPVSPANNISVTGNSSVCAGQSTTIQISYSGLPTPQQPWLGLYEVLNVNNFPVTGIGPITMTPNMQLPINQAGTFRSKITIHGIPGCEMLSNNTITIGNGVVPLAAISSPSAVICNNIPVLLSAATGTGYSYQWFLNGNNIIGAVSSTYSASTIGNYYCRVMSSTGCSAISNSINISSSITPAFISANTLSACNGNPAILSANTGIGLTYQWLLNGNVINGAVSSDYLAEDPGMYTCIITNSIGCAATSNVLNITSPIGSLSFIITGTTGFCRPSANNIYNVSPAQAGATYNWTLPAGATITSGQGTSSIVVSYAANAVAGNINVSASYNCETASTSKAIILRSSNPSTPGSISGSNVGCSGDAKSYTIRRVANADYYIWTPPIGATINGSSASFTTADTGVVVTYGPSFNGDSLRVSSGSCRGISAQRKLRINKTNPSTPGTISGLNIGLCNLSGVVYSINAVNAATSYTWRTNIAGATINGNALPVTTTSPSATVNFGAFTTGQIYVKANNGCGSSNERSLTVNAKPAVPSSITGPAILCDGQTVVNYSTVAVNNATSYGWTVPSGSSITTGQGTLSILMNAGLNPTTGNVRVRSQNSCANSAYLTKSITINNCPRFEGGDQASGHFTVEVYPNPVKNTLYFDLKFLRPEKCNISISDINGRIVKTWSANVEEGLYTVSADVSKIVSGIYILNITTETGQQHNIRISIE